MKISYLNPLIINQPEKIACVLILLLMLGLSIRELSLLFEPIPANEQAKVPTKDSVNWHSVPINRQSPVFNIALFGIHRANLSDKDIKQSTLKLTILGILYSTDGKKSHVLIQDDSKKEHSYQLGDTLSQNAVIKKINADHIVVEYKGRLEKINFSTPKLMFEPALKPL